VPKCHSVNPSAFDCVAVEATNSQTVLSTLGRYCDITQMIHATFLVSFTGHTTVDRQ
jgi:hypothetical protein